MLDELAKFASVFICDLKTVFLQQRYYFVVYMYEGFAQHLVKHRLADLEMA